MSTTDTPLVSAIVTTRNNHATLEACLASVRNQTYKNIEIVVVDRDSTDDTKDIARRYTGKVYNKGPERSMQRNFAVEKAAGQYVAILDSDMELTPDVIAACVAAVHQQPGVSGVVIPEESFGQGFWAQCKRLERSFYNDVPWMQAARFFARSTFLDLGGYNLILTSGEDWEFSQRVAKQGRLVQIAPLIMHNEGHLKLRNLLRKKIYYGQKYVNYAKVGKTEHTAVHKKQTGIIQRYGLFLMHPVKLFRNPLQGCGMLFMKTAEFSCAVLGLMKAKLRGEAAE